MIQAIGLTSLPRRHQLKPAVDDLTFEARPGRVTVLLGPRGSGKTTALRLLLQMQPGKGVALFRGRPVQRIAHFSREVGVLFGEVPAHPARTTRSHLRMLAAAVGVPSDRADDVLDVVGLSGLADQRIGTLSRGMDRRLGVACALLGDPHTLVMDEPAQDLSPREAKWLHSLLRGYAQEGGTVLVTSSKADETADLADRVVSIDSGRLVADQWIADFVRTRLRPRVAVRTPHAERLAALLGEEARKVGPKGRDNGPLKVVLEDGNRLSVYGSSCSEVGEFAFRHGILVHQLTDERGIDGDAHMPAALERADGRDAAKPAGVSAAADEPAISEAPKDLSPAEEAAGVEDSDVRPLEPAVNAAEPDSERRPVDGDGALSTGEWDQAQTANGSGEQGGTTVEDADPCSEETPSGTADAGAVTPGEPVEEATGETAPGSSAHAPPSPLKSSPPDSSAAADSQDAEGETPHEGPAAEEAAEVEEPSEREVVSDCSGFPRELVAATARAEAHPAGPGRELQVSVNGSPPAAGSAAHETDGAGRAVPVTGGSTASVAVPETEPYGEAVQPEAAGSGTPPDAERASSPGSPEGASTESPSVLVPLVSPDDPTVRLSDTPLTGGDPAGSRSAATAAPRASAAAGSAAEAASTSDEFPSRPAAELPPRLETFTRPGPVAPSSYELRRMLSVRTTWLIVVAAAVATLGISLVLARTGIGLPPASRSTVAPAVRLLAGWPSGSVFFMPPLALAAGLLGALSFGEEFRYPALNPARSPVPHRLSLLAAKLAVTAAFSVLLSLAVAALNAGVLSLCFGTDVFAFSSLNSPLEATGSLDAGGEATPVGGTPWQVHAAAVVAFTVGCGWVGLLAAGVLRTAASGVVAVLAVPLLVAPALREVFSGSDGRTLEGFPERLETVLLVPWPPGAEQWVAAVLEFASQPAGPALALSLAVLLAAYLSNSARRRFR